MFTGIITEIGTIQEASRTRGGISLSIDAPRTVRKLKPGDSISIDGACHTVTDIFKKIFVVFSTRETIGRTVARTYKKGTAVNLELPTKAGERIGGHVVLGHVDAVLRVLAIHTADDSATCTFTLPKNHVPLIVEKGSVAVNGISLTVTAVAANSFSVSLIPYTLDHTTLQSLAKGSRANVEYDILAKHAVKRLPYKKIPFSANPLPRSVSGATIEGSHNGSGLAIGIILPRFNEHIGIKLLSGALTVLHAAGVREHDVTTVRVPGAFEIPSAAAVLARSGRCDAIIALGVVIRGETSHYDQICNTVARNISSLSVSSRIPIAYGIVTAENARQAAARAGGSHGNRGSDAAIAAVEMATLMRQLTSHKKRLRK